MPDISPLTIELPLRPMLGCLGVAPGSQGSHFDESPCRSSPGGGNMDYAGLTAGVKVMLPVSEPGALLFLGDAHAARQGEGEVVGIKVSRPQWMSSSPSRSSRRRPSPGHVSRTRLTSWSSAAHGPCSKRCSTPRANCSAGSCPTTGYPERGRDAMGQALELDVANVVDPSFTVVAKIRKSFVPRRSPNIAAQPAAAPDCLARQWVSGRR